MKYILTIDDDEALCKLVKKCIETEQVPVYTFLRGEDALSFFYQNQSDCVLVILDIMLPGMDGYSVLEKVRAVSNVPVLMLMPGIPKGSPTCQNVRNGPAPSKAAASSKTMGTASNPRAIMNTVKAEKQPGRIKAQCVSSSPSLLSTR